MTPLPTIASIQEAVAAEYGLPIAVMRARDRIRDFAWPRQEAMYLSLLLSGKQSTVIGRQFNRDHSTVLEAEKSVQRRLASDDAVKARMRRVTLALVRR